MRRGKFIGFITAAALAGPLAASAQDPRVPTVGLLVLGNPNPEPFLKTFRNELEKSDISKARTFDSKSDLRGEQRVSSGRRLQNSSISKLTSLSPGKPRL
jgi:hypothetical protein